MIKAVGFDVDGTLYPNYQMFLCSLPSLLSAPRLMYYFGQVRKDMRQIEYDEPLHEKQAQLLSNKLGISEEHARDRMERHLYHRWEHSFRCISPFRQVRETLLALKRNGIILGALSDFPIKNKLKFLNLDDLFDFSLSSEDTGYLKPNPIPFQQMIREFGTDPDEILYVGNSYKYDVLGAAAAGMRTAWLKPLFATQGSGSHTQADIIFSSFSELRSRILNEFVQSSSTQK
ncbi:MAG: HAD family hydrolase [Spirochaetaceae bacterium]|nr:HAD family hydrolase [Spirochaetaceae bacterium]MCF7946963.1 HAD family hydrolase [Spirochaetia bacterium]MCF7951104.1 HAD family hydrolase [Spirochaetaceae bacterium]